MKALIFLAHGSRREKSNREVFDLVDEIRPLLAPEFDVVDAAFLELVPPYLPELMETMLDRDAQSITIYPFFLNSGRHVDKDIPAIVDGFRERYPEREILVMRHFGGSDGVLEMIISQLKNNPA